MTDYQHDLYRNWNNIKYLEKNATSNLIFISNKIKKTSGNGPFIDGDIAEFIFELTKNGIPSLEEIQQHVELAIRYMRKGDEKNIIEILKRKLN